VIETSPRSPLLLNLSKDEEGKPPVQRLEDRLNYFLNTIFLFVAFYLTPSRFFTWKVLLPLSI